MNHDLTHLAFFISPPCWIRIQEILLLPAAELFKDGDTPKSCYCSGGVYKNYFVNETKSARVFMPKYTFLFVLVPLMNVLGKADVL